MSLETSRAGRGGKGSRCELTASLDASFRLDDRPSLVRPSTKQMPARDHELPVSPGRAVEVGMVRMEGKAGWVGRLAVA